MPFVLHHTWCCSTLDWDGMQFLLHAKHKFTSCPAQRQSAFLCQHTLSLLDGLSAMSHSFLVM